MCRLSLKLSRFGEWKFDRPCWRCCKGSTVVACLYWPLGCLMSEHGDRLVNVRSSREAKNSELNYELDFPPFTFFPKHIAIVVILSVARIRVLQQIPSVAFKK